MGFDDCWRTTDKMVDAAKDIDKTIAESRKGFTKGTKKSLKSLGNNTD